MKPETLFMPALFLFLSSGAVADEKLSGRVIGTEISVDYATGEASRTANTREMAFDGDLSTFFASYDRNLAWCGLDLGSPHVITRVAWSPRDDALGPGRVVLGVFEGGNEEDFSDAVPLYMNDAEGVIGQWQQARVDVSRAFRYVRYVGPADARCNIAEVEFYGYEDAGDESRFYRPSNLPLVVIHTSDNAEPQDKTTDIACTVTLVPSDAGDTIKTKTATIRLRGNASMNFPKKPYRIKFDKKHHVFSSPASAKKWTLINNYGDKTLMRNILAFEASRRMGMEYTPFCTPVDVMLNGEYKGCYQLSDQIEVGKGRVEVEETDASQTSGEDLTGGYLVEVDAYAYDEDCWFWSSRGNPVTVKYPDSDDIAPEQLEYIKQVFNDMESDVFSTSYTDAGGWRTSLDAESFLRYFLTEEFAGNTDAFWSTFMYKHRDDGLLYTGPVWDFDLAFENDNRTYPVNGHSGWLYTFGSYAGNMKSFTDRIVNNSAVTDRLLSLWEEARREKGMDGDSFLSYVDETAELLEESQRLNFLRWPILSTYVHQNWQATGSWEKEVETVKDYIAARLDWIDAKLGFEATGVKSVGTETLRDGAVYTPDGRRLEIGSQSLPRGVYIRNGRKFVVR